MLSIDLLINPDWPTLATVDLIHIALNEIESLERSEEAKKFIFCKFVLALNKDLHSPLTLAASIIDKKIDNNEKLLQKITMLEFLIKKLQHVNWHYGPINLSTVDLTGIEINYPLLTNYEIDSITYNDDNDTGGEIIFGNKLDSMINYYLQNKEIIDRKQSDDAVELRKWSQLIIDKINTMQPALQWLCQNDCDKAVLIPSVQEIIQKKWRYTMMMMMMMIGMITMMTMILKMMGIVMMCFLFYFLMIYFLFLF